MRGYSPLWDVPNYSVTDNNWDSMHCVSNVMGNKHQVALGLRLDVRNTEEAWADYEQAANGRGWEPGSAPFVLPGDMQQQASRRLHLVHAECCPLTWRDGGQWVRAWDIKTTSGRMTPHSLKAHDWNLLASPLGIWAAEGLFRTLRTG